MTYYAGNPYKESVTAWAHDDCLPESEFEVLPGGFRRQRQPWNWSPKYGAARPCQYCNQLVN